MILFEHNVTSLVFHGALQSDGEIPPSTSKSGDEAHLADSEKELGTGVRTF
jgi:hypothetical protein